jgi:hypothetical protein
MSPPPEEKSSYLEMIQRDSAQRCAEFEEIRRLKHEITLRNMKIDLANLSVTPRPMAPKRKPLDFYEAQITEWFNRLPPTARAAHRTMQEFINLLEGRTPGMRAHAPDVSRVLQRMGWVRRRIWQRDGEGRRVWLRSVDY